jgi:uncharacterized membrane protein
MKKSKSLINKEEILEILKDKEYLELIVKEIKEHNHSFYSSPLPKSEELDLLEEKYPGITKKIMDFANKIHNDSVSIENKTLSIIEKDIETSAKIANKGQNIALYFITTMFLFAGFLMDKAEYGLGVTILGATATATIISSLMREKLTSSKNNQIEENSEQ